MELMQLEMFVAVVEERSFLRAAERVFPYATSGQYWSTEARRANWGSSRLVLETSGELTFEVSPQVYRLRQTVTFAPIAAVNRLFQFERDMDRSTRGHSVRATRGRFPACVA